MPSPGRARRPLERSYVASLVVAVAALVPYVIVSTALTLYRQQVMKATSTSEAGLEIILRLSEAGYAFGALVGGDLAQRYPQRPLFLLIESTFVIGAILTAMATSEIVFGAGAVLLGLTTGLQLIVALPPLIRRFPPQRLPISAACINVGFFGAVSAGSFVGAIHAWRWFHGGLAAVGVVVLGLAFVTLPDGEPPNAGLPFDRSGVALALPATVLPFWACGALTGHGFDALHFWLPLSLGLACFIALLLTEFHKSEPLAPIRRMWTTFPVLGTLVATAAGGIGTTLIALGTELVLRPGHQSLMTAGVAFAPQIIGTLLGAVLLGVLLRTRGLPALVLFGMLALLASGVLLIGVAPSRPGAWMLMATGLLGIGAGATVSPGLYLAGFSLPSEILGRIFALVELVRSVGDYVLGPVMIEMAREASGGRAPTPDGIRHALWITLAIAAGSTLLGLAIYFGGITVPPRPDVAAWLNKNRAAMPSPRLFARLRPAAAAEDRR